MREIAGEKYKLAGIGVYQKGTLVDVFAKFCRTDENIEQIIADENKAQKPRGNAKAKPGTVGALLANLPPLPRMASLPSLSVQDIVEAVAGKSDLQRSEMSRLRLTDTEGVIKDLGPEKLAQVLVEMGEARKQVLEQGQYTFVPLKAPAAPKA